MGSTFRGRLVLLVAVWGCIAGQALAAPPDFNADRRVNLKCPVTIDNDFAGQFAPDGFMPTVRRRVTPWLEEPAFATMRTAILELLAPTNDTSATDARIRRFCAAFPQDDAHRWTRDLAAELLHNVDPERFPLMTRWVWDLDANTGVLREIWHGPDVDHTTIRVQDDYATFLVLREELAQFLATNGVFRDVPQMVDMLCAQVYAHYICEQGGSYLRADFSAPEDPMQHTRRMLGLDGVRSGDGRARLAAIDGEAH